MHVCYVSEAEALQLAPRPDWALISITEPGRDAPLVAPLSWGALLRIRFADAEYDAAMLARLSARGVHVDPDAKGFPCSRHAVTIRAFLTRLDAAPHITSLVIHCHAGQRRSAAVAKYACETLGAAGFDPSYQGYNKTVYALLRNPDAFAMSTPKRSAVARICRWLGLR